MLATPTDPAVLTAVKGVSKAFGRNAVLKAVSFSLHAGEVLALVGENGAGKSTLMNILSGNLSYDSGSIELAGQDYRPAGPSEAIRRGIAIAHQETAIMPDLTVAENIYFRREPRNGLGLIRQRRMHGDCRSLMAEIGFAIDPGRMGRTLSAAERQMVEIARAIVQAPKVLVLDEPTASLSAQAAAIVLDLMAKLKAKGTSVIFISHRLSEIMEAADRVVVLKDGELTLEARRGAFNRDDLIHAMVGRKLSNIFPERPTLAVDETVFALEKAGNARLPAIDLKVRRGEILGIAGLEGQGQKPLADALCGAAAFTTGTVRMNGAVIRLGSPSQAIAAGIASIPDDRKHDGLALGLPIRMNMSLFAISGKSSFGFLPLAHERQFGEQARTRFSIRSTDLEQPVGQLSGGNQQKVVFARWLADTPKLLVLYEPTKGVDIQSKSEIYHLVGELTRDGVSVILISSDLIELIGLSDRILTLYEGRISGEIGRGDFTEERIMRLAAGVEATGDATGKVAAHA
jgi:ABC-type sugar transport system ATPase subunit